jgi:hypothetical protein
MARFKALYSDSLQAISVSKYKHLLNIDFPRFYSNVLLLFEVRFLWIYRRPTIIP